MKTSKIPFHLSDISDAEIQAVTKTIQGGYLAGNGPIGKEVEAQICAMFGCKYALLTPSCTHAMEMALMAQRIGPGDEVIMPSFTFTSTANAVLMQGASIIFCDIDPLTLTIDPAQVKRLINKKTRAIMPVNYAGVSPQMDEIVSIAEPYGISVIEDAAQGVGARYKGRFQGTWGQMGCYSFHGTKIATCGEGGAFITDDPKIFKKAEIIREKGTNRSAFLRGEIDKYTWVDVGSSYVLSDILAALLGAQLARLSDLIEARKKVYWRYIAGLQNLASEGWITLPTIPTDCESNYHIFHFHTQTVQQRDDLLENLKNKGIGATFHYVPLHGSPIGRTLGHKTGDFPVTEQRSSTLVRLPIYPRLEESQQDFIIDTINKMVL